MTAKPRRGKQYRDVGLAPKVVPADRQENRGRRGTGTSHDRYGAVGVYGTHGCGPCRVDEIVSQKGGPRPPFCCSAAAAWLLFVERGTGVSFVGGTLFTPKSHWGSLSASRKAQNPNLSLAGMLDADGAAVILHAKADDYKSDPAGNAGDRVACGVVEKASP